ncbi:galactosyltransferase-related protein [Aeromonas veronii]|uniref:galactosyltransferase-related protein n=1 Tax=Aeromonas veronii TaxID=654 RepID=UPI003F79629A
MFDTILSIDTYETRLHVSGTLLANLRKMLKGLKSLKYLHRDSMDIYSAGQARNEVAHEACGEYLFFVDADILLNPQLLMGLSNRHKQLAQLGEQAFEMYPCLYLTKEETERFNGDFQGCLESFLHGENHRVEGIALASSCLLMNREWFLQLGGFDEQFVGHGGEDLELIDRLTRHYPIGPRPDDYALNIKAQHPGDYQGFRRYFSYYVLPHLFAGRFLVHQWHPRPLTHPYHKRRANNDQLLEQMLARSEAERGPLKGPVVPCNDLGGELPDFREWMIRLQEEAGYPVSEYPGLLRWQEGVQRKRPLWRKLRKLYINPRAFFADMR